MRIPKLFMPIVLSFFVIVVGIGFAAVSGTISFTGNINFQHKELYISKISNLNDVTVIGYSGTLVTFNQTEIGGTLTISVTNPTNDTYYYLNYTAPAGHKLWISPGLGTPVPPKGIATFNVTLNKVSSESEVPLETTYDFDGDSVKLNFTLIPPYIPPDPTEPPETTTTDPSNPSTPTDPTEPPETTPTNPPSDGTTNATAALEFVINDIVVGLNSTNTSKTFEQWCSSGNKVLFCLESSVQGNNLDNAFAEIGAKGIYFTLQWVSETQYDIYLYYKGNVIKDNNGRYITVYKQEIIYNSEVELWAPGDSYRGYAKVVPYKNNGKEYQIELEPANNPTSVVWYEIRTTPPDGSEIVPLPTNPSA